jgi:hypothetical protein
LNFEYYVPLTSFNRSVFNKELTLANIMKFTKDDNMKCLVVEYANASFYGFNLVDKDEGTMQQISSRMLTMTLLSLGGECQKIAIMGFILSGMAKLYHVWSNLS